MFLLVMILRKGISSYRSSLPLKTRTWWTNSRRTKLPSPTIVIIPEASGCPPQRTFTDIYKLDRHLVSFTRVVLVFLINRI